MSLPPDMIAITITEWDRVKLGHDRYEFLRRCSLRQLTQIWEAAMKGDIQFDAEVDRLRALPERGLPARATGTPND